MRVWMLGIIVLLCVGRVEAHAELDVQIAVVTEQIAVHPGDAGLHVRRGELHRVHGDWEAAERDYARAKSLDPTLAIVDFCRGHMLLRSGRATQAVLVLDTCVAARPHDSRAHALRAEALAALGRPREAAEGYDRALVLATDEEPLRPDWRLGRERALAAAGLKAVAAPSHIVSPTESAKPVLDGLQRFPTVGRLVRGPYLQSATPTSIVVRWRTNLPTDSVVVWSDGSGSPGRATVDRARVTDHIVKLEGLSPDTRYRYTIGSTGALFSVADRETSFVTPPVSGSPKPTRIWVLGDSGTADATAARVRDSYAGFTGSRSTDVWLMLGDNAYPAGTDDEYQKAVFEMYPETLRSVALWPTFGNHDGVTASSSTQSGPYYDVFTLPVDGSAGGVASGTEAYYAFDHANIHFVCLDSYESDRAPDGAMLSWLARDLATEQARWTIVFWHHPPYSKGSHDTDYEQELVEIRQNVLPILEARGVDLVLTGHSHSYERSFLLDGYYGFSWDFNESYKKAPGDGGPGDGAYVKPLAPSLQSHAGAVYAVAGSSGQISGGTLDHPAMVRALNVLGSLVIDVDGNRLDATFLDDSGVVRDSFTIVKSAIMPPTATTP